MEELASTLAMPAGEVVKILFMKGIMVQVNQVRHTTGVHHTTSVDCSAAWKPVAKESGRCSGPECSGGPEQRGAACPRWQAGTPGGLPGRPAS